MLECNTFYGKKQYPVYTFRNFWHLHIAKYVAGKIGLFSFEWCQQSNPVNAVEGLGLLVSQFERTYNWWKRLVSIKMNIFWVSVSALIES